MLTKTQEQVILDAVSEASSVWKQSFNTGNAQGCANQYEPNAVMDVKPFGRFEGYEQICNFWQGLIDDGFCDVEYIDPVIEVIDENSALLKSAWKMNKAHGVIHKEIWVLQDNGMAKLREDSFEVQG